MNKTWSKRQTVAATRMWVLGKSAAEVSRKLGKSRCAVMGKWNRLGLKDLDRDKHPRNGRPPQA